MLRRLSTDVYRAIDSKLGRCPFCMRASLYGSLASWLLVAALAMLWPAQIPLASALVVASGFTLLALSHVVAHSIRVWRYLTGLQNQELPHRGTEPVALQRRVFLREAVRSSAAFALVAAFGTTLGVEARAKGQSLSCSQGGYSTDMQTRAGTQSRAKRDAKEYANRNCTSYCSQLMACPTDKPACRGIANIGSIDCTSSTDPWTGQTSWTCTAAYNCKCSCAK